MNIRQAPFALRVVRRHAGDAAILYRRRLTASGSERLDRVAAISPLAFASAAPLLRSAVRGNGGSSGGLAYGPFHPLDHDWGARVACYALVARGLRNAAGMRRAADNLRHADGAEAAWWFGLLADGSSTRALRALRILVEAVK